MSGWCWHLTGSCSKSAVLSSVPGSRKTTSIIYLAIVMYMGVLTICMSVYSGIPEKVVRALETGVKDIYELPCGCLELNPSPLEEQLLFLTTKPSFQTRKAIFKKKNSQ